MESLIVKRLRGIDSDVMPPRRKLNEKQIKIFETWISEGAKFDGFDFRTEISTVANVAATRAKSHKLVVADRDKLAIKNWKLIMSSNEAQVHSTSNFRVLGEERFEEIGRLAEQVAAKIESAMGADDNSPFVKGNVSIYLFKRKYDLNELGMMLVNRQLEGSQPGRWDYTTVDAYAAILLPTKMEISEANPLLIQQLTAIWVASKSEGTPRWFADAIGYLLAVKFDRKSSMVRSWRERASSIAQNLQDPGAFTRGKLSETDAGLAGYAFVEGLKSGGQLKQLIKMVSAGRPFNEAFTAVMGSAPNEFFQPKRKSRRR